MADDEHDYEAIRLANIARNKALLESLGLNDHIVPDAPANSKPSAKNKKKKSKSAPAARKTRGSDDTAVDENEIKREPKRARVKAEVSQDGDGGMTRRSSRNVRRVSYANDGAMLGGGVRGRERAAAVDSDDDDGSDFDSAAGDDDSDDDAMDEDDDEAEGGGKKRRRKSSGGSKKKKRRMDDGDRVKLRDVKPMGDRKHDPKQHGAIPDVKVGTWFETRAACSQAAIHAPWVAGIHGDPQTGAYSIALSGGYSDDVDLGELFTYTGAGGRDLKGTKDAPKNLRTAPQSCDQDFEHKLNKTLQTSAKTKNPVRVIRGYKLPSEFAPSEGYRYDGLYQVEKAWMEMGLEGFKVCKYALKRLPGQPPLPRKSDEEDEEEEEHDELEDGDEDADVKVEEDAAVGSDEEVEKAVTAPKSKSKGRGKKTTTISIMPWTDYLERIIAWFFINFRNRDKGLFTRQPAFEGIEPTIKITSPIKLDERGQYPPEYIATAPDGGKFPGLEWTAPPAGTAEQLLIIQDVDVPVPSPIIHGVYYGLPPTLTSIPSSVLSPPNPTYAAEGITLGKNYYGNTYMPPRPIMSHGPHRYFYQVIALKNKLEGLPPKMATMKQVLEKVKKEDILAWGEWIGIAERRP